MCIRDRQSGDTNDKENFVDLLIERVSVEEKSTKQHLIDEAIEILPSLSPNCLQLLTFLAFSQLMKQSKISEYENWINSINPILDNISKVTSLDIDFLNQANCTFNTVGFHSSNSFIDNQLKSCNLLFRHKPPRDFVDKFFAKHQITRQDNTYLWPAGESFDKIMTLNEIFDLVNYQMCIRDRGYTMIEIKETLVIKSNSPKVAEWVKRMKAYKAAQLQDMAKRGCEVCDIAM